MRKLWSLGILMSLMPTTASWSSPLSPLIIKPGQKAISVYIPSNASTGYRWYLDSYQNSKITPDTYEYLPPVSELVGAPGTAKFTFNINANFTHMPHQLTKITFRHLRPWEEIKDSSAMTYPLIYIGPDKPTLRQPNHIKPSLADKHGWENSHKQPTTLTSPLKPLAVKPRQKTIAIYIQSNGSSGYSWYLESYDNQKLKPETYQYLPPPPKLVGASGTAKFTFAIQPSLINTPHQVTQITFRYLRPWEGLKGSTTQTFSILYNGPMK